MASFLSGLMGGLNGLSSGRGLMGALGKGFTPLDVVPGATVPAERGLMATIDPELSPPEASFTPSGAQAPEYEKPGFFSRINDVDADTGMSTVDKFARLGASLQDIDDGGARAADLSKTFAGRVAASEKDAERKAMAAQIKSLFPDDPRMQFLLMTAPDKAAGALADVYKTDNEAYTLGQGQGRYKRGDNVAYNDEIGVDDGYAYRGGVDGFEWGPQRDQTWAEQETRRSNLADEETARGQLDVSRGNLGVSRGNLALSRDRFSREGAASAGGLPAGLPPLPPGFRPVR